MTKTKRVKQIDPDEAWLRDRGFTEVDRERIQVGDEVAYRTTMFGFTDGTPFQIGRTYAIHRTRPEGFTDQDAADFPEWLDVEVAFTGSDGGDNAVALEEGDTVWIRRQTCEAAEDRCGVCGERLTARDERNGNVAEMFDSTVPDGESFIVHAECGLASGWELA